MQNKTAAKWHNRDHGCPEVTSLWQFGKTVLEDDDACRLSAINSSNAAAVSESIISSPAQYSVLNNTHRAITNINLILTQQKMSKIMLRTTDDIALQFAMRWRRQQWRHHNQHVYCFQFLFKLANFQSSFFFHEPRDQGPGPTGVNCLSRNHLWSRAKLARLFSSWGPVLHQMTMSSIYLLSFVPSTMPNISVFNFPLSSILHM